MTSFIKVFLRFLAGILSLIFISIVAIGIVGSQILENVTSICVGISVFGFIGFLTCFAGCIGAGFENERGEKKIYQYSLQIFFVALWILFIIFSVLVVALFTLRASVDLSITLSQGQFDSLMSRFPNDWWDGVGEAIKSIKTFMFDFGIVMIFVALIILTTVLSAGYLMGFRLLVKFFITSFSIVEIVIGFALGILLVTAHASRIYIKFYGKELDDSVLISIIVFMFFMGVVGFLGILSSILANRWKVFSGAANILNALLFVVFFGLFITSIALNDRIFSWARSFCDSEEGEATCNSEIDLANKNYCNHDDQKCGLYERDDFVDNLVEMIKGWLILLMFACLFIAIFLVFIFIFVFFNCFSKTKKLLEDPSERYTPFNYSAEYY